MGYAHLFYRVDLERLKGLFGSHDDAFARKVLMKRADDVQNNDLIFEASISEGACPDTATVLREILAGTSSKPHQTSMYGYVLKIICEHIGKQFGDEVAVVRDHPYESQLVRSGPPVPIPYDPENFPQIGFLSLADLPAEINRLTLATRTVTATHAPSTPDPADFSTSKAYYKALCDALQESLKAKSKRILSDDSSLARDMDNYYNVLRGALTKRVDIISFRH